MAQAVIIHTQVLENYGSPLEPYWKRKGGSSYYIANVEGEVDKTMILNGLNHIISEYEERRSCMVIETVGDVELTTVEDAEERSLIDRDDIALDYDDYIRYVEKAPNVQTWSMV